MPEEHLGADELEFVCFADGAEVVGDDAGAASFVVKQIGPVTAAWLLLVVVAPDAQRRGRGTALVRTVAARAADRGALSLHLANAVPRYLWPGVDLTNTRAGMLFEATGFEPDLVGVNMAIATTFRHDPPDGVTVERGGRDALDFAARTHPNWVPELATALDRGTAFVARAPDGTAIGFGCHSVNRRAWVGPMATDPTRQGTGVGSALLAAVCRDLHDTGADTAEIAWVSNLRFYGKCGATVSRVFQGGRLRL
jgi:GNAT superfamily N-acetyltransferase